MVPAGLVSWAQPAMASNEPVRLTFDKAAVSPGVWQGTLAGDIEGSLTTVLLDLRVTGGIWQVEFDWIIDAGPSSFTARLSGVLNTTTGAVVMNGTVVTCLVPGCMKRGSFWTRPLFGSPVRSPSCRRREAEVARYLLELYVPKARVAGADWATEAQAAARSLVGDAIDVRYVRSIIVPGDETCFHVFEASSAAEVEEVARRAGIRFERVVPLQEIDPAEVRGRQVGARCESSAIQRDVRDRAR